MAPVGQMKMLILEEVIISNHSKVQIGLGEDLKTPNIVVASHDWLRLPLEACLTW